MLNAGPFRRCHRRVSAQYSIRAAGNACVLWLMCASQLVKSVAQRDRPKAQAVAETIQQVTNTIASVGSGVVTGNFGWPGVAMMSTVPLLLCIVATALTCYAEHNQRSSQDGAAGSGDVFASISRSIERPNIRASSKSEYASLRTAEEE